MRNRMRTEQSFGIGKNQFGKRTFFKSVSEALFGVFITIKRERNMKFHLLFAIVIVLAGGYFKLSSIEWCVIILIIALVITAELVNTAIEFTVDLFTRQQRVRAKLAKEAAAGAVLVSSIFAIVIGILVFYNKVISFFSNVL